MINFILSSISSGLEYWSVNHTSIYENSELKVFKKFKLLGEIFNNWPNDLWGTNVCKILKSSVISKWGTFKPFLSLVILLLVRC